MSTEDSGSIIPFDNIPRYIPVDTPLDGIYPISYYTVTNVDLTSLDYDLTDDSLQPTVDGNIRTGAGGSTSIDSLIPKLIVTGPEPTFVNVNENTSTTFSVDVTLVNDNTTQPTFQWQKKESNGSVWNNIANAKSRTYTTPNTVFANDYLDQYRCIVTAETALNSPVTSQDVTLNVRRVINITTQPNFAASYFSGETATVTVGANITSGAISYQWQRKDMDQTLFVDIPTASGATYTTPSLSLQNDNTDIYRCVLTNSNADPKITNEISLNIKGADLKVTPGVVLNGSTIRFWSFLTHGPLILDSANATSYQVECIESSKTIRTDLWGQGSCNSRGGYSNGWLPMTLGQVYTVRLNAGRGSSNGNLGGGYAGIFNGTSITQANALLIAGGAGGGGRSSASNCTFNGGAGGAPSGGNGDDVSVSQTGGDGGTQSSGGAAGTTTATQSTTVTYDTEGSYSVSIPSDAINVTYEIVGATGGQGGTPTGGQTPKAGGRGQRITGSLTNVAGQTLSLTVGSPGQNGSGGRDVAGGAGGGGYKSGGTGGRSSALSTQSTVTNDYSNSNFNYNLNIPSNITSITFDLTGGRGGNGGSSFLFPGFPAIPGGSPAPGGTGAWGQRIFVTPTASSLAGKQLNIFVGGAGQTATGNNGFDFGAPGGNGWAFGGTGGNQNGGESFASSGSGGGGGGSSAILTDGGVMVVLAGGGGGGGGAAYEGAGGAGTTSTRLSTLQNFGNAAAGQVGSGNNASGGGGGSGQFDFSDGDGGSAPQAGNSSSAGGGKGGGGYYSTTYIQSSNISSSVGNGGGFVRVVYTALNESVSIASGGGGGGSSAITLGGVLLIEAGGGGGSGGAATSNTPGTPVASTTIGTTNNSSNGSNGADACAGFANSGAGGGGGGNAGGAGGTSTCSGAEIAGGGGTSGSAYRNTTYVSSASVSTGTTAARISITYSVPLNATAGSALQGGTGGQGTYPGGGGGGGYWGGGGAAGNSAAAGAGGGGGGSGFISPVVISGVTSGYVATVSGVSRGTAGDINGGSRVVFNLSTITITQQPIVLPEYLPGDNVDLSVTATISAGSGVTLNPGSINYQWQRRLLDSQTWVSISGATNFSYTIPNISLNDYNGNSFRCVLSNFAAATVISNVVTLNISGADLKLSPSVNGKTFWTFKNDGALILDPSVSTNYSIVPVNSTRTRLLTKMWGQGSCSRAGGYSSGAIPIVVGSTYSVRLNAGAGAGGTPVSGGSTSPGGGYAGIFNGTTISQASALLIAGGAGGDGLSSTTCSGTTEATETITTSTTFTETKEAGLYHERSGGVDTVLNLTGEASAVGRSEGSFVYTFYFSGILFDNTNYTVNSSNAGEFQGISANGTFFAEGFYPTILNKYTDRFEVEWKVNGTNALTNVRYQTFTATGNATITNTNTYTASPRALGGAGGGTSGNNGTTPDTSLINAQGGGGGSQSAGGSAGTTSSGGSNNGSAGSALQGGTGGTGSKSGNSNLGAAGGGGGGGGYWGGGGGGGGSNQSTGIRPGGGGGGGSGFVAADVTNGSTSTTPNLTDVNRGTAGNINANSRIVIDPIILLITSQPTSFVSADGSSATFNISATISGITGETINYQWQRSEPGQTTWTTISGATSATYVKTSSSFASDHNARYRCVASNPLAGSVTSQEVYLYVIQNSKITLSNPGEISYTASSDLSSINVKIWGAGGAGFGECNNAGFAGGTGGFVGFSHVVTSGQTIKLVVGATDKGSSGGEVGSGAGDGGGHSALYINDTLIGVAGGGGGAGQSGFGGGGGGNGSGRSGSGTRAGGGGTQSAGGSGGSGSNGAINGGTGGSLFGGFGGGSGLNVGNRGGGGGSGYFGGGGGGGDANGTCTGAGGGGGSGFVANTATNITSTQGVDGVLNGSSAVNNTDPDYVANRAGSNQNGLIVIEFIAFDFTISPAVGGRTQWSLSQHGTLIFDSANATSYTLTPIRSISRLTKAWGQGASSGTQTGGYATGIVSYGAGTTYQIRLNAGSGGNRAGGYAGIFVNSVSRTNAILIGSGGGGPASTTSGPPGATQIGSPPDGGNATLSAGGDGGTATYDNFSSADGFPGGALFGGAGGPAGVGFQSSLPIQPGFYYYYGTGNGGGGGGGYYGGGGGGGGTAAGNGAATEFYEPPGSGGRGISFASTSFAISTSTNETPVNASNRGTAGNINSGSRVVIEP